MWGVLSFGFLIGAGWVARRGLGAKPLRALLLANLGMWSIAIAFTIRENIWLLAVGILIYMALIPVAEAAEQTLLDQRLFMVSGSQYQALLEMLDRPASDNPGLVDLFSRRPVWAAK